MKLMKSNFIAFCLAYMRQQFSNRMVSLLSLIVFKLIEYTF